MRHKIVAYQIKTTKGEIAISAMTESPRGTRTIFKTLSVGSKSQEKAALRSKIELAIAEMVKEAE